MKQKSIVINCPNCKKQTIYGSENQWRPFCSQHCYQIDLGAWANEDYRIPSNEKDLNEEEKNNTTNDF